MAFPNTNKDTTTNNQLQDIIDLLQSLIAAGNCCAATNSLLTTINGTLNTISYGTDGRTVVENVSIDRYTGANMGIAISAYRTWAIANAGNDYHILNVFADTSTSLCVVWMA